MNETIGGALIFGMKTIESTLASVAPKAWEIMIRQQYVMFIENILGIICGIVCIALVYKFINNLKKKCENAESCSAKEDYEISVFFLWILLAAMIIGIMLVITSLPGYVINPEYYAIKDMVGFIT